MSRGARLKKLLQLSSSSTPNGWRKQGDGTHPFASAIRPLILASSSHTDRRFPAAGIDLRTAVAIDEASIRAACAADNVDPVDVAILLAEMKGTAASQPCDHWRPAGTGCGPDPRS